MRTKTRVCAIVGAQLGSEGKGVVSHHLAREFNVAVRTGAPNAGHSICYKRKTYKMQSIPCTWPNPECQLVIGRGALINVEILMREITWIREHDPAIDDRLIIDSKAGILEPRHHEQEGGINGKLHKRMGSTGEGVGAARVDRMARDPERFRFAGDLHELRRWVRDDTPSLLERKRRDGYSVLLEGTQGAGLSLIHGSWPWVTTSDTNAAQLAADAGVPPQHVTDVILVARTYPIRVAGPSGPMVGEKTWAQMSHIVGRPLEERTTVTNKVRRIAEWDEKLISEAVTLNAPSSIVLTFMDYLSPADLGKTSYAKLSQKSKTFIEYVTRTFAPVDIIGTGWDPILGWTCVDTRGQERT